MKPLLALGLLLLAGCSDVGFGLKNHPGDCAMGIAWADCLPGTMGYEVLMGRAAPRPVYQPPIYYAPPAVVYEPPAQRPYDALHPMQMNCSRVGNYTNCTAY